MKTNVIETANGLILQKETSYPTTVTIQKEEMLDLVAGKYIMIAITYVSKIPTRNKNGKLHNRVFYNQITDIKDFVNSVKSYNEEYFVVRYR